MKKTKLFLAVILVIAVVFVFVGCIKEDYLTSNDGDYKYELITVDDVQAVRIIQYIGSDADVVIPATIDTYPVAELGDGLFIKTIKREESKRKADVYTENTQIKTVTILADIKEIPARAFYYCTELTDVVMPNSVEIIRAFAFYNCTKLENLTLPSSVKEIEGYAFRQCENLTNINILSTELPVIGDKVFYNLDEKKSGNAQYQIINGLSINVADIDLYNIEDIENYFRESKSKAYLSWVDYIKEGIVQQIAD